MKSNIKPCFLQIFGIFDIFFTISGKLQKYLKNRKISQNWGKDTNNFRFGPHKKCKIP